MKLIHSRDNPFYKELVKISSSSRQRSKLGQTLLDGVHLLAAYLDAGMAPLQVLINSAALNDSEVVELLDRCTAVPITQLDAKLFAELSALKTPSGVLTLIDIPQPSANIAHSHFALLLEDIQDPGNLGSILRSAAAAGCDAVFLSSGCADAWSPKVLRAAMGGHFMLHIEEQQNLLDIAKVFSGTLLATNLHTTNSLYDMELRGYVAFMFGNEGAGLSTELMNFATHQVNIPMAVSVESLNAAAAAAVCLFEAVRQRRQ